MSPYIIALSLNAIAALLNFFIFWATRSKSNLACGIVSLVLFVFMLLTPP